MKESSLDAIRLSIAAQISSKAINLVASILLVRMATRESIGIYTVLILTAQFASTLGRLGTNYSYIVLLPKQENQTNKIELTNTYILFSLISTIIICIILMFQLSFTQSNIPSIENLFLGILVFLYLLSDSISEIFWTIHLAFGNFKVIFLRDVWISIGKGILPLVGYLLDGVTGIISGLLITSSINLWISWKLFQEKTKDFKYLGVENKKTSIKLYSWESLTSLLKKGLPFFSVPLISNLILWPILIKYVDTNGFSEIDGLRVAQICAQIIGGITASLMPVLIVKLHAKGMNEINLYKQSFHICSIIFIIIFSLFVLADKNILPLIFGSDIGSASNIPRIFVAGSALQGLCQIPLQRVMGTKLLIRISILQIASLILAALLAIYIFNSADGLIAYTSITLISPLMILIALPKLLKEDYFPESNQTYLFTVVLCLQIVLCYAEMPMFAEYGIALSCLFVTLLSNKGLISETIFKLVKGNQ